MSAPDFYSDSSQPPRPPPAPFLAELYRHLPFLVVHLTVDGIVLHCNPVTTTITGYEETFLVGRNFWAVLFPGKLFAQIPRFISPGAAPPAPPAPLTTTPLLSDTPLTLRTRDGGHRIVAFTRFLHSPCGDPSDSGLKTMVCIGVDLTDRLLDSDKEKTLPPVSESALPPFGPQVGNGGTVDGEVVTPIAISPPSPIYTSTSGGGATDASAEAIRQAYDFLSQIEARMTTLQAALEQGPVDELGVLAQALKSHGAAPGFVEFSIRARGLQHAAAQHDAAPLQALLEEMLAHYHPHRK